MRGVMSKLPDLGINIPSSISDDELLGMTTTNISNATANIKEARRRLVVSLAAANMAVPKHGISGYRFVLIQTI
jgi:hypothetical protein